MPNVLACQPYGCIGHTCASYGCQGGQTFPCPGWPYMCLVWWPLWLANHLALAAISMHRVLAAAAMSMPNMVAVAAI